MADFTTTTLLNSSDRLLGMSGNGRFVSYVETSGADQALYVLDLNTGQKSAIDTFTLAVTDAGGFSSTTGIDGGIFSSNGRYLFYSTGLTDGNVASGTDNVHFFVRDLEFSTPPVDVTPPFQNEPFPGILLGLSPKAISDDGQTIAYDENFEDFTGTSPNFKGVVAQNLTTGSQQQFSTQFRDFINLSPDGNLLTFTGGAAFSVENLQSHTEVKYAEAGGGAVSNDGRYTVYQELLDANGQPASAATGTEQLLVHDNNASPSTPDQIISTSAAGTFGNDGSIFQAFSGDGRHVVFESAATNLVPNDTDGIADVFVKNLITGEIQMVQQGDLSGKIFVSSDGSRIIAQGSDGVTVTQFLKPTLTINPITGDDFVNAADGSIITISGTSDAIGQTINVSRPGSISILTSKAVVQADGTWSTAVQVGGLADGSYTVHATVTNELAASVDRPFTIDRTPPSQVGIISVAGDDIINAAEIAHATVTGTILIANPNGPGSVVGELQLKIDQNPSTDFFSQASSSTAVENFSHNINASGVADGTHTITLTAFDEAGNKTVVTKQVLIDTTPPAVAILSVSGDDVVNATEISTPQSIHGTSDAIGQTVTVLLDGVAADSAVVQPDGTWLSIVNFSSAVSGNHTITAQVSDAAGNIGQASTDVTVDTGFGFERLSVGAQGEQGDGAITSLGLSTDGTRLLFTGNDFGLPSDINQTQVFIKDLTTGALTIVTPNASDNSDNAKFSANGEFISFYSNSMLDPDTHAQLGVGYSLDQGPQPYVEDLITGQITFMGLTADDVGSITGQSFPMPVSNDGTILYTIPSVTPQGIPIDVLEYRVLNGAQTEVVIPGAPPSSSNLEEHLFPQLSADGTIIAFQGVTHVERDFTADPDQSVSQIYAGTLGNIVDVSTLKDGTPLPDARYPVMSADGRYIAFWSGTDVYLKDRTTGDLTFVAHGEPSDRFSGGAELLSISADGHFVAFTSDAPLTAGGNHLPNLFVKDMVTGSIQLVPLPAGTVSSGLDTQLSLSEDGHFIAFATDAALVADDTNGTSDIYGTSLATPPQIAIDAVTGNDRLGAAEISNHVAVTGTSDAIGQTMTLLVDGAPLPGVIVAADGTWSTTFDATGFTDGVHRLQAQVTNALGSTETDGDLITVDTVAPTVTLSSDKTHLTAGQTATITAAFSEGIGSVGNDFFTVTGGSISNQTFVNDHTLTATFTAGAGADTFTVTANPGTAFDFAGNPNTASGMTAGLAFDGYLSGSFVFMDANGNGVYDPGEASTTTDVTGHFVLSGGSGPLVLEGGFDNATMLPFNGVLAAPEGFGTITPLTTLASYVQQESGGDTNSLVVLVDALAHASGASDLQDIVTDAGLGQADAQAYLLSSVQIADAAALMASALAGASGLGYAQVYTDVMHGLAHTIVVNGADTDLLAQVPAIMSELGQTYGLDPNVAQNIAGVTNSIVQNIADAAAHVPMGVDGTAFLTDLYGIARLADGAASDAVGSAAARTYDPFGTLVAEFSNDSLARAIVAATAQTTNADLVNHAPDVTGSVTLAAIAENSGARLITQAELLGNVSDDDGPSLTATGLGITTGAGTLTDNLDGTWSYAPAAGDDTAVTFTYQVTDDIAAPVSDSATLDITPTDTTADVGGDLAVKVSSALVSAAGRTAVGFTVTGLDPDATAVVTFSDTGGHTITAKVTVNGSGAADLSTLQDGNISLGIVATDTSHNMATGAGDQLTLDTIAAAPGVALAADSGASGTDHITNSGVVNVAGLEAGATWQYSTDNGAHWLAGTGSSFTLTGDGGKSVLVHQTDLAGNISAAAALSFTLDTIAAAPGVTLAADSGASGTDHVTNSGVVNVAGLEAGATWQYSTDNGAHWLTGIGTSFTLTGNGSKSVLVDQTDLAGNTSAAATLSFILDTIAAAPGVVLATDSGASATDHLTNSGVVNVTGLETGATWQYSIDSGAHWLDGAGSSFTLTGDGGKSVLVHQTDLAGNDSAAAALSFTLDTTTSDAITTASATVTSPTQTIQGTGEIGDSIQLHDGSSNLGGLVTVDASGHWAETVALTGVGDHIITALATDLAGNSAPSNAIKLSLNSTNVIDQPGELIINGTPNADQIVVHANNLLVAAGGGDDVITIAPDAGRGFFHLLEGGPGNDTLDLSRITDDVSVDLGSGLGGDTLAFARVSQTAMLLLSSIENVTGGSGNDTLIGNDASNVLNGGAGADTIRGGNGNDTVIGGSGNDILSGGSGDDVFVFRPGFGHDRIASPAGSADFQVGTAAHHDTLDLRSLGFASVQDVLNHTDPGANAVIHAGVDDITLIGVTKAQLQMHSFDLTI